MEKFGRLIGKLASCNPIGVNDYIIGRVREFDKLVAVVADSLKYHSGLATDALAYCLVAYLSEPVNDRRKHDTMRIAPWFTNVAEFSGLALRKSSIEMSGLLQYVASQLKDNRTVDLLVLKELIQKVSGIEATDDLTDEQLEAMSGGSTLRQEVRSIETMSFIYKTNFKKELFY